MSNKKEELAQELEKKKELLEEKREKVREVINRCGRLSDTDLSEIFGGNSFENELSSTGGVIVSV